MHTLLPFDDFKITAIALSSGDLREQAQDCTAILDRIHEIDGIPDWTDKTVQAWRGSELQLCEFGLTCCEILARRTGITEIALEARLEHHLDLAEGGDMGFPAWWGDEEVHLEYKGLLIYRNPERYQPMWPSVASCPPERFRYPLEILDGKSI